MIIVRSPLRISLGGGGTDLPTYYQKHGGFVLSAAIDKYVYVTINESFRHKFTLKYSKLEEVDRVDQIEHPAIREAFKLMGVSDGIDLANLSDIPAGTGLGSSGSFTAALLKALHVLKGVHVSREELAEMAYHVEREMLGQPVGKQDQYISAVGGITPFIFHEDDTVTTEKLKISRDTFANLEDNLLLFFTGYSRSASDVLRNQDVKSAVNDVATIDYLHRIKKLGTDSLLVLQEGDLETFADLMNVHWELKKERDGMSSSHINELYELGLENGAWGGKLVGAGGGGFLLFYAEKKDRLRKAMAGAGLREVRFRFDMEGTKVIHS